MSDFVQELIHHIPRFGAVVALFPVCFKVFAWVEDRLSITAKQDISAWLKSTGNIATSQILSFNLSLFHSQLFGDKQFAFKCFKRSILFSFLSFFLISLPAVAWQAFIIFKYGILPLSNDYITVSLSGPQAVLIFFSLLILLFVLIVFPLDFLGIGVTRKLAARAKNDVGLKRGLLIFLLDTVAKAVVFPIISIISGVAIVLAFVITTKLVAHIDLLTLNQIDLSIGEFLRQLLSEAISQSSTMPMWRLFPFVVRCSLLCSAWVWLYLIGLHLVRRAVSLFDVDRQPVRSIGIIGAAVITGCYGLYTAAVGPSQGFLYAFNPDRLSIVYEQDYDRAIADYSEAIRLDPSSAPAFISRSVAYSAKKDYDHAIADLNEAIRLDPKNAIAFNNRGWQYNSKQDYDSAVADLNEAIRLDPKNAIAFVNRSKAYHAKQDYDSAIADLNEAIRIYPKNAIAFNDRGWAYSDKQDYNHAIADYSEAIRLDPKAAIAFNNRSWAYYRKQDYDRAIADLNEAIRLDPKDAIAFDARGRAFSAKQDYDHAIADYSEASRLDPKYAVAFNDCGWAYSDKQDYDRAIADLSEAIRLDPKYAIAFNNRARIYIAKQDYDSAIADYTEAVRLDPKYALAFRRRGIAYYVRQDYGRAIADLNEAIRLDPKFAANVLWLYLASVRSGSQTATLELETNAKNLNPSGWPYRLVELFLGRRTPETTLAAATKLNERCTAQFHTGEWQLSRDDRSAAKMSMQAAVDICPKNSIEYDVALVELQRLQQYLALSLRTPATNTSGNGHEARRWSSRRSAIFR
jgi:tetratricopeptide (TPR) repeat protein